MGLDGELKSALSKLDLKLQAKEERDLSITTDFGKITHVQTDLFEVLHAHRIRVREGAVFVCLCVCAMLVVYNYLCYVCMQCKFVLCYHPL